MNWIENKKIINIPNLITFYRIFLAIVIIFLLYPFGSWHSYHLGNFYFSIRRFIAVLLFSIGAFSDYMDGWWARRFGKVTTFGKFFDAVADKIFVNTIIIILIYIQNIPLWAGLVLILRDFYVDALKQTAALFKKILAAHILGKITTVIKMLAVFVILLLYNGYSTINPSIFKYGLWNNLNIFHQLIWIPFYLAIFFSLLSAGYYTLWVKKYCFNSKNLKEKHNKNTTF